LEIQRGDLLVEFDSNRINCSCYQLIIFVFIYFLSHSYTMYILDAYGLRSY